MKEAPHRAVRLVIAIEADTRQAMVDTLDSIGQQIAFQQLTSGVSGGYNSRYTYEYKESELPTHDEYVKLLNEYLEKETINDR
jgi:hypothetical protein